MKVDAWHLPWGKATVAHGILDINRDCNISCRACYNSRPPSFKSLAEIEADLQVLKSTRHLAYVTVVGGEVLLHPQLHDVLRMIKSHNLVIHLFTNGLLLNDDNLADMKILGVDIIYVHIDGGQTRPDLARNPTSAQLQRLWDEKINLIASHGIDVGMTMTAYAGDLRRVRDMVDYAVMSPYVNYLLVTLFRDTQNLDTIRGSLDDGMRGSFLDPSQPRTDTLNNWQIIDYLQEEFHFRPFGYLGSNRSTEDPRWLSYMVITRRNRDGKVIRHSAKASLFERAACQLSRLFTGKYPFYLRQNKVTLLTQLVGNAVSGGDFAGNIKFLLGACRSGTTLRAKRLLFQCPAQVENDGTITHCRHCPDAVPKFGKLVPLCISDKIVDVQPTA